MKMSKIQALRRKGKKEIYVKRKKNLCNMTPENQSHKRISRGHVIKFLGENPGACPWNEAKKYFFNPYRRYFLNI